MANHHDAEGKIVNAVEIFVANLLRKETHNPVMLSLIVVIILVWITTKNLERVVTLCIGLLAMMPGAFTAMSCCANGCKFSLGCLLMGSIKKINMNNVTVHHAENNFLSIILDEGLVIFAVIWFLYTCKKMGFGRAIVSVIYTAVLCFRMTTATDVTHLWNLDEKMVEEASAVYKLSLTLMSLGQVLIN